MPDHEWVRYKSIRGKPLPAQFEWRGRPWRLAKVLKFDFYAATGLYEAGDSEAPADGIPTQVLYKVYHDDGLGPIPLGWLGRWLCEREVWYLNAVGQVDGVPRILSTFGRTALIREFVPGKNLREHGKYAGLRDDFFPRLKAILARVHAAGISHNDLSKPENILVNDDGQPILIDFQIALGAGSARWSPRRLLGPFVRYMQGVDRYHLRKIHRRYRPFDFTEAELAAARKKGLIVHLHSYIRRPYRSVRHFVLDRYLTTDDAKR
jgi:predicted Ser/Thr protein kinase